MKGVDTKDVQEDGEDAHNDTNSGSGTKGSVRDVEVRNGAGEGNDDVVGVSNGAGDR